MIFPSSLFPPIFVETLFPLKGRTNPVFFSQFPPALRTRLCLWLVIGVWLVWFRVAPAGTLPATILTDSRATSPLCPIFTPAASNGKPNPWPGCVSLHPPIRSWNWRRGESQWHLSSCPRIEQWMPFGTCESRGTYIPVPFNTSIIQNRKLVNNKRLGYAASWLRE